MSGKDFKFSEEYKQATKSEQMMLDALSDILFEVQYAKAPYKTQARRNAALSIVRTIKETYIKHLTIKP